MEFGRRLKEVREHLGYSQAEFARACGIGKTAQYMYEKGDREPPVSYIQAARELGADVLYLLTGEVSGSGTAFCDANAKLFMRVADILGLDSNEIVHLSYQRLEIEEERKINSLLKQDDETSFLPWYESIKSWLLTAKSPDSCLDIELLSKVMTGIESHISTNNVKVTPEKKVKAAIMLYRAFKATGEIDQKTIDETVNLAAQSAEEKHA